jgi:predicted regulator of Ras-like GTPase activity (Roadblock/LC7/MglB family)
MDAAQALADLTEISTQIESAVLAGGDGKVLASTFGDGERGERVAASARELLAAADELGAKSAGQRLVQLQAALPDGSVFLVRDDRNLVAAVTGTQPTVGLVFYDLKTCLRLLEREEEEKKAATTTRRPRRKKEEAGES